MKESLNITYLIEGGYCNIPRAIVDKIGKYEREPLSPDFSPFFKKAYFNEGLACGVSTLLRRRNCPNYLYIPFQIERNPIFTFFIEELKHRSRRPANG